jgi:exopolysaccharide biosynthesis polyprenyl glycosylphosphotransferase
VDVAASTTEFVARPLPAALPQDAPRRVLIVGTGRRAMRLAAALRAEGVQIVGAIDDDPQPELATMPGVSWLGGLDDLVTQVVDLHVDEIYVAQPLRSGYDAWIRSRDTARRLGIPATLEFDLVDDVERTRFRTGTTDAAALFYNLHPSRQGFPRFLKRLIDVVLATIALAVLSPLLCAAAVAVALTSPGPVFFLQDRVGAGRRSFRMLKLRTMVVNGGDRPRPELATIDPYGVMFKAEDDPRITRVGRWLRRTSIDELPQLINVIAGDMSLVGPRPMPLWVYERVRTPEFHRRSAVLPGMTGLWQVNGRVQDLSVMTRDDLAYVDGWSLRADIELLLRTPGVVLRGSGAR